ncbi:MAG: heavy metal-binding domain-containing protein [Flavobacteriales bacterium]
MKITKQIIMSMIAFSSFTFIQCTSENKPSKKIEKHVEQYSCPMKCEGEKTYDKPGECPVCHMDLKKM